MYKENSSEKSILEVQKVLEKEKLLMLRDLDADYYSSLSLSVKDILYDLICKNEDKDTYFVKNNDFQCFSGRKRSQGDLCNLMRYYYPQITLPQLRQLLLDLVNEKKLSSLLCGRIRKRVFYLPNSLDLHRVPAGKIYGDTVSGEFKQDENQWKIIDKGEFIPDEYGLSFIEI